MSSNNSLSYKRAARILTVACGLLFSIFSIVYLFVLQKDVVGALHYSLSQGKTHYSPMFPPWKIVRSTSVSTPSNRQDGK